METLLSTRMQDDLTEMIRLAATDPKAELESKVLAGRIRTKDEADRIVKAIQTLSSSGASEEHRATFTYSDGLRVVVTTPETI